MLEAHCRARDPQPVGRHSPWSVRVLRGLCPKWRNRCLCVCHSGRPGMSVILIVARTDGFREPVMCSSHRPWVVGGRWSHTRVAPHLTVECVCACVYTVYVHAGMEARIRIGRKLSYTKFFNLEGVGVTAWFFSREPCTLPSPSPPPACLPFALSLPVVNS